MARLLPSLIKGSRLQKDCQGLKELSIRGYCVGQLDVGAKSLLPDFENPHTAFESRSAGELLKSYAVLSSCRIDTLVRNSRTLFNATSSMLGRKLATRLVEKTFYDHFCLGYNDKEMGPKIALLRQRGIMPILNYASEDHVFGSVDKDVDFSEARRDVNAARFIDGINSCSTPGPHRSFASVKVTGLGDPDLLAKLTPVLRKLGDDTDRGQNSSKLDSLAKDVLTKEEFSSYKLMLARLHHIATTVAKKGNTRVMIDAEGTHIQPAIDAIVIALQQQYNKREVVIMNTYQCYLKDSETRVETDLKRSIDEKWHWGAKTVRGAYLRSEKNLATEEGRPSPIHETLQDTHSNYDRCVAQAMTFVARGGPELMVATHNQRSVENALAQMQVLGIKPKNPGSGMCFGQLLGMADNLTYPLGKSGYNAYKVCAYGEVELCINFLIRRALENSDVLGGCGKEIQLIRAALLGKFWGSRSDRSKSHGHQVYA